MGLADAVKSSLDVVVGGLGLGYTAQAVLEHQSVKSLIVVEALEAVINWHETALLPHQDFTQTVYIAWTTTRLTNAG